MSSQEPGQAISQSDKLRCPGRRGLRNLPGKQAEVDTVMEAVWLFVVSG